MHTLAQAYKAIALIRPQVMAVDTDSGNIAVAVYEDDAIVVLHAGDCSDTVDSTNAIIVATSTDGGSTYTTQITFTTLDTDSTGVAAARLNLFGVTHVKATCNITVGEESGAAASFPISIQLLAKCSTQGATGVNSTTLA